MNSTNILITGAYGLLGGRLAKYLSDVDGLKVNLATRNKSKIKSGLELENIVVIDWDSESSMKQACEKMNTIIHCAGMNAHDCQKNPEIASRFNGYTTGRFLDAAIDKGVSRFVFFSTAHVYDSHFKGNITENITPKNPHPYAASNYLGEQQVNERASKISGINIRLSNAFGAPVSPEVNCWALLINDLCRQAIETKRLVLKSDGSQLRDFISITEVCRAIHHLLSLPLEAGCRTFNVGGASSQSVLSIAKLIQRRFEKISGFSPELQRPLSKISNSVPGFTYDTKKLVSTGFRYSGSHTEEIDQLINFCERNFKGLV